MSTKHASGITGIVGGWSDSTASRSTIALYEPPLAGRARCTSAVPRASLPFALVAYFTVGGALWPATGAQGGFPNVRHVAQGSAKVLIHDGGPAVVGEDATTDESDHEVRFSASDRMGSWTGAEAGGASIIALDENALRVSVSTELYYSAYYGPAVGGEAQAWVDSILEFPMPASEIWWAYLLSASGVGGFECSFRVHIEDISRGLTLASFEGGSTNDERILGAPKGNVILVHFATAAAGTAPADDRENHYCQTALEMTFTDVDCNGNDVYDPRDIERGTSVDNNEDGVPDECGWPVIYVNIGAPAGGDGLRWQTAFSDLQDAIDLATERNPALSQIWIAKGSYVPTRRIDEVDSRSATFALDAEIEIYGGFAGNETKLAQRNAEANPTILSGDLLGDDAPGFINRGDNAYHVLLKEGYEGSVLLDGLTIRGGQADGGSHGFGGALRSYGNVVLRNCNFIDNWSGIVRASSGDGTVAHSNGGGAVAAFSLGEMTDDTNDPTVVWRNCHFADNASSGTGGAVFLASASLKFKDCTFERNSAPNSGAIGTESIGALILDNCEFVENTSAGDYSYGGGAVSVFHGAIRFEVVGCDFQRNTGTSGGAILAYGGGLVLKDTRFQDNSASENGGAVYDTDVLVASVFADCEFVGNRGEWGGGLYADGGVIVERCVFSDNDATGFGGGLAARGSTLLVGCTFTQNSADEGGGVYDYSNELTVVDTPFERNYATIGGAVFAGSYFAARFERCHFSHNSAYTGGGVAAIHATDFLFDRCAFNNNFATIGGGLFTLDQHADTRVTNCLFAGNGVYAYGGGIAGGAGKLLVDNCTIADNTADALGAGIIAGHETTITNSIVWGNVADPGGGAWTDEVAQIEGIEFATINYSDVQGWSGTFGGDGNIGLDPLFVEPIDPDGPYDPGEPDFHLRQDSPCIDAGLTETVDPGPWYLPPPNLDLDGKPRVLCKDVDMGAYEFGLMGDVDCNFRVDLRDFSFWPQCAFGPGAPGLCPPFDADGDGDIDLRDAAALFRGFSPTPP